MTHKFSLNSIGIKFLNSALSTINKQSSLSDLHVHVDENMLSVASVDLTNSFAIDYQSVSDIYFKKPDESFKFIVDKEFLTMLMKTAKQQEVVNFEYDEGSLKIVATNTKGYKNIMTLPLIYSEGDMVYKIDYELMFDKIQDNKFEFRIKAGEIVSILNTFESFVNKKVNFLRIIKENDEKIIFESEFNENRNEAELTVGENNQLFYLEGKNGFLNIFYKELLSGLKGINLNSDVSVVVGLNALISFKQVTDDYIFYMIVVGNSNE